MSLEAKHRDSIPLNLKPVKSLPQHKIFEVVVYILTWRRMLNILLICKPWASWGSSIRFYDVQQNACPKGI